MLIKVTGTARSLLGVNTVGVAEQTKHDRGFRDCLHIYDVGNSLRSNGLSSCFRLIMLSSTLTSTSACVARTLHLLLPALTGTRTAIYRQRSPTAMGTTFLRVSDRIVATSFQRHQAPYFVTQMPLDVAQGSNRPGHARRLVVQERVGSAQFLPTASTYRRHSTIW